MAGVDEAGRGALAGPVVAAAVILAPGADLSGVRDSKTVPERERERLFERLTRDGHAVGVGLAEAREIDATDIRRATLSAMARALTALSPPPDFALVDGDALPQSPCPARAVVRGDALSASVAAASLVAKVTRDRLIRALEKDYPEYGFFRNKGYGTREHLLALGRLGPCPCHRMSFGPCLERSLWDGD